MGRGWVPPGYKYLGPGNDLNRGEPTNAADALAKTHDENYDALIKAGAKPYTQWSDADQAFFKNLHVNDIPTAVAKGLFGIKKGLHNVGIIGKATMGNKKLRTNQQAKQDTLINSLAQWEQDPRYKPGGRLRGLVHDVIDNHPTEAMDTGDAIIPFEGQTRGRKRDADEMEAEPEPEAAMARAGGDSGNTVSKETPISIYPSLSYGIQDTHTTILPWTGFCSVWGLDDDTPVQIKLRMNSPYAFFPNTTLDKTAALAKGIYNSTFKESGVLAGVNFPAILANNSATHNVRPQWRAFWANQYSYYTVLGCEYKITVHNNQSGS
jgi:hypothetical protein